jgi:hypothetical protein
LGLILINQDQKTGTRSIAQFWLGLEPPDRGILERRAEQAGWGVAEWLEHLHGLALTDLVSEDYKDGAWVANPRWAQPGELDREVDRRFRGSLVSDRVREPPARTFRERLLRWLFT